MFQKPYFKLKAWAKLVSCKTQVYGEYHSEPCLELWYTKRIPSMPSVR